MIVPRARPTKNKYSRTVPPVCLRVQHSSVYNPNFSTIPNANPRLLNVWPIISTRILQQHKITGRNELIGRRISEKTNQLIGHATLLLLLTR